MEKERKDAGVDKIAKRAGRRKRRWIIVGSIAAVLLIFRLFLPAIVLKYVNKQLGELEEYYGHVENIDIALIRGAYVIKDIKLVKIDKDLSDTIPFFECPRVDLSVEWKALFKGSLVGKINLKEPVVNFVKEEHKGEDLRQDTTDFRQLIRDLMPFTVNKFSIEKGEIHYRDIFSKPALDVYMDSIYAVATNLSNVTKSANVLPARLDANGNVYGGTFRLRLDFDALSKVPTFDANAELTTLDLTKLNDFLKAYGNFEVTKGHFGLYTEFAAKEGSFGGYVKPLVKDMDVKQLDGDAKQVIWEMLVGAAAKILENKKTDQVATKVAIQGRFEDPDINTWRAVSLVLRNAFVHALKPAIDHSINIHKLKDDKPKTFLEKVFGTGEKKKDEKKEKENTGNTKEGKDGLLKKDKK
jgi:hypothetical protein